MGHHIEGVLWAKISSHCQGDIDVRDDPNAATRIKNFSAL